MKSTSQKMAQWLKPGVATIALLSLLTIGMQSLSAKPIQTEASPPVPTLKPVPTQKGTAPPRPAPAVRLPGSVKTAVLRAHARDFQMSIKTLRVVSFSQETWPDSCLGLGRPEATCGLALVSGWRVEVSNGAKRWFYRTDRTGRNLQMENTNNASSLPRAIEQKVLAIAAKDMGVPVNQLKLAAARARGWDGCLGVADPTTGCTMILIPGWQVIVTAPQQYGVYHLNQTATLIKQNPTTSGKGTLVPTFLQPDPSMDGSNTGDIIFQSMTSGGIAGLAYKTLLMKDGKVMRIDLRQQTPAASTLIRQLTSQEVQAFVATLQQNEFSDFLGFNYASIEGADYFTIALTASGATQSTQYVDMVQDQTPPKLQQIIQAWNRITNPR
ncbi:hypothetical protein H6F76_14355 [Leptolyngbya sp. FACHB-321]|uniref:hypothetical protein n=1 Tax=Leptolyngbya sp. FACHB-321 TaxID=2692807 RepID=UPI00168A1166|nr:hypothetical protein [Leptolyngbya sp. FACHB-321]MBD2036200.1 hypothetical protein [Leptolyngbya sp. FACHB-321]